MRSNLVVTKQRQALSRLLERLSMKDESLYYNSTVEVAAMIHSRVHQEHAVDHTDYELLKELSVHDIQILLSLHDHGSP